MKIIYSIVIVVIFVTQPFAQNPDPAFNPMTANGANGISLNGHTLYWSNPLNAVYNEVYFSDDSAAVANLSPGVRIYNGYPLTLYSSALLNVYGTLDYNTKYYWRVVEHNASGSTPTPIWDFNSMVFPVFTAEYQFDSDLEGWEIIGPYGYNNWYWSNTSAAGGTPGEMAFRWDPIFIGDSYLISPVIPCPSGATVDISFRYYEDWWSDTVVVGSSITSDDGNTWTSIWELHATGNVGPSYFNTFISAPDNFRIGFYYTGDSNNIDFLFVDDVIISTALSPILPPGLLLAQADSTELNVNLEWGSGGGPSPYSGYRIQRKSGLPSDTSSFNTIVVTDANTFSFEDNTVELNNTYTYRICTLAGPASSSYGNEATAYVPANVPVELISFNGSASGNEVTLIWATATETNNSGFEIERSQMSSVKSQKVWEKIGFVSGSGTTTEPKTYSYIDENLSSGVYQYRLKQIDFDGSFEYSNIVEVEVTVPIEFSLEQNYPNPFNPSTNIKYSIPADGNVTLKVYDILGNEVITLVNGFKQAGTFDVMFDGSNLSSGVYYYRLTSGEMITTKKLMLTK